MPRAFIQWIAIRKRKLTITRITLMRHSLSYRGLLDSSNAEVAFVRATSLSTVTVAAAEPALGSPNRSSAAELKNVSRKCSPCSRKCATSFPCNSSSTHGRARTTRRSMGSILSKRRRCGNPPELKSTRMKKSQDEATTAKNLEEKFDRGEDVLDYFDVGKARWLNPKSKEKAKSTYPAKRNSARHTIERQD